MNKKDVTFGASVAQKSGGMGVPVKELTPEEIIMGHLQDHAIALNSMALWIAENDAQVAKEGNVNKWAMKLMQKRQRLAERKAAYKVKNAAK